MHTSFQSIRKMVGLDNKAESRSKRALICKDNKQVHMSKHVFAPGNMCYQDQPEAANQQYVAKLLEVANGFI
jgi:hypothetical protein